ncbi:hypothetical protein BLA29_014737 [Euroglyphus maynei]|uniref:Uncharacterized protein n=1 Tax=Euroglyphus maynei TaxID=6958 RepID=A0A1Y3B0X1_EURMA|nr:hypothetical protein BLA29_014737 [Euroglyphus maynei]
MKMSTVFWLQRQPLLNFIKNLIQSKFIRY